MTTPEETNVLDLTGKAWGEYLKLPVQHPDEVEDFKNAIHILQGLIAIRVARRADPVTWPTFSK